jgi:RecA-family ATPase
MIPMVGDDDAHPRTLRMLQEFQAQEDARLAKDRQSDDDTDQTQGRDEDGHGTPDGAGKPALKPSELYGPLPFINMAAWDDAPPPPRQWAVPEVIPLRQPTLLTGEGAIGKSIVELMLAAAHPIGHECLGLHPVEGPSLYVGAEDEGDELHRRLYDICNAYGVRFADLIRGGLHLLSYAGEDCLLAVASKNGLIEPTALFKRLLEAVQDIKPIHTGIDTVADTFGGNENDRSQVRQYVGLLRKLAMAANGSLVLLGHPSLTGISTGTGLSGSTGWHNSVRARMYLQPYGKNKKKNNDNDDEEDEQTTSDLRELVFKKSNYGPIAKSIALRYHLGVFVPVSDGSFLNKLAREQQADEHFITMLRQFTSQGRSVSPNKGRTYAPAIFADHPNGRQFSNKEFALAMERLLAQHRIHIVKSGPPSKPREDLAEGAAP